MYYLGIDSGSMTTKAALMKDGSLIDHKLIPTGWSPRDASLNIKDEILKANGLTDDDLGYLVGTGYGRVSMDFIDKQVTEITCHAKGAYWLNPEIRTIVDIGGQDSKIISLGQNGQVVDFLMNDKCAAGTGRFLQVMMNTLGKDITEIDHLYDEADFCTISSMCTVFAESEVVSLLAGGRTKEAITSGILESIATRTVSMLNRTGFTPTVGFTGGVSKSKALTRLISNKIGSQVFTSELSQLAGAIGAALIASEQKKK